MLEAVRQVHTYALFVWLVVCLFVCLFVYKVVVAIFRILSRSIAFPLTFAWKYAKGLKLRHFCYVMQYFSFLVREIQVKYWEKYWKIFWEIDWEKVEFNDKILVISLHWVIPSIH